MVTRRFNTTDLMSDPFFIGFDRLLDKMDQGMNVGSAQKYPPYNIVKTDEHQYMVELAVAGFSKSDIKVKVEDGSLIIEGSKSDSENTNEYLHRGISSRSFKRIFTLSDTIVVNGADLDDGILKIALENVIPEERKPRTIEIGSFSKEQLLTE